MHIEHHVIIESPKRVSCSCGNFVEFNSNQSERYMSDIATLHLAENSKEESNLDNQKYSPEDFEKACKILSEGFKMMADIFTQHSQSLAYMAEQIRRSQE